MSGFAWRLRPTKHFGEQWVPFAELSLRAHSGRWHAFSVQVDSGAAISVLPRSAADLLGLAGEPGEAVDLAGLGGPNRPYLVHTLYAKIGTDEFPIRIAFADRENVPNLLGRLDLPVRFQIHFNPKQTETLFAFDA